MGCCDTMLRYIVFLINFVFFMASVALIAIGAYISINMKSYLDFLDDNYTNASLVLIIIGAIIMIVAFFGCCGACTESPCMMYTYGTLMALILISLIGVAITIVVFKDDVKTLVEEKMKEGMQKYDASESGGVTETWNIIQHESKCCGVEGFKDWENTPFYQKSNGVPDSCCVQESKDCGKGAIQNPDNIYQEGCFAKFENTIVGNVAWAIGIGVAVAVLILIGICIACCQARTMKERMSYA